MPAAASGQLAGDINEAGSAAVSLRATRVPVEGGQPYGGSGEAARYLSRAGRSRAEPGAVSRPGDAVRLSLRGKGAPKQRAVDVMLRQNRALVVEEIADAILESQFAAGPAADPLQRARDEQARMDAATARRIGQRK